MTTIVPGDCDEGDTLERSAHLITLGFVAGDLASTAIARYTGVTRTAANHALQYARLKGLLNAYETDAFDDITCARLIADLPRHDQARIHAAVSRHKFTAGPEQLSHALHHRRTASQTRCCHFGHTRTHGCVSRLRGSPGIINPFCDLATAADGLGHIEQARQHLALAMTLGELASNAPLVTRAAVMDAPLVTRNAGNPHTAAFLQRAEAMPQSPSSNSRRPSVGGTSYPGGKPPRLAARLDYPYRRSPTPREQAVADSKDCDPEVQCFALMAWRSTHRA